MNLEKVLRGVALASVFALPFVCLFVAESLFFPYITGKNFAFRIIVEIGFGAWLALALVSKEYRPRTSWVLASIALFTFIMLIADLNGAYPFKSIWSNYERMDGWVTLAHVFAYVLIAASVMKTERNWRWLMWTSLGVSLYLSVYGFLQIAGFEALGQGGGGGFTARIDATFGNPIYFAAYMLFHVFIAGLMWAQSWVARGPGKRLWPSLMYATIIALDTLMLLSTGTRGTILGLVGGGFLTSLLVLIQASKSKTAWRISFAGIFTVLLLVGAFFMFRDATWIHKIGFLDRMATISSTDSTTKARFYNWGMAWEGVKERPLLGWGQENYALVFDKYYDPRMHGQEPWFDRVHNIVFDWLVAGGFLGLLAYLSIFATTLWVLWRPRVSGAQAFSIAERAILTGLLGAYFAHNFFVFDNVTSYILFGTVLAYVLFREGNVSGAAQVLASKTVTRAALPFIAVAAVFVVWGLAWEVNGKALAANRALLGALSNQGDFQRNVDLFKKSIAYGTYGTQEAREQLAQGATQVGQSNLPVEAKRQIYELATREMTLQSQESPLDARFPLFLGIIYDSYGDLNSGAAALEKAQELSPRKQSIYFERAQNAELRGDGARALDLYRQAMELLPSATEPRIVYAAALIRSGRVTEADPILEPLVDNGRAADQRILAAYMTKNEYARVARIWSAYVRLYPGEVQGFYTLAAVYYSAGDKQSSIAVLEDAASKHPEIRADVDSLKKQILDGTVNVGR